ncbi:hypothetical protein [Novosphingobium sp.]|uniref:hypothetical protein n=1 Tax=Novosphingobium sp. TaxID=1874826 RepID=UPI0022BB9FB7|nr:hypothetical protein [Novosphingobium sp.]MCZ8019980.1 hypothetical protein [Novosphingobium sp.]MCZ8035625.1 hypothetical protein [Novosphingobium sp.]MCZ8053023.1 hypothetical protein [Novosphingobium sp.]MCZ8061020.1 hypothetical protein [Novosphingobium sp.]MCZ8230749.1 hypothetical protein [Novosphingobium sp.]
MKKIHGLLLASCSAAVLAGCGPSDIASPGTGGNVIINPAPTPTPTPTPTGPATVTPAAGCPTIADPQGLTDAGTISGPTGTWRVCSLPNRINRTITLTKVPGLLYQLPGRVDVGTDGGATATAADTNVVLNIEPGVIVFGGTGVSWLHVNRGNRINAAGTATNPIVFTSRDNVLGLNTETSSGQWGGIVLSGRAPTTDCTIAPAATPGSAQCERQTEGAVDPAIYGGANPADNSGTMRYVQIRYSGYVLSGNSELQSLTLQGVGTGTQLSHIQSVNSSDDGIEIFGGRVNMKYLIVGGAEDDSVDTDTGTKTNIQYLIAFQRPGVGNGIIEADSDNSADGNTPRQNTRLANVTFLHTGTAGDTQASILLRGGTDYSIANGVMVSPNYACLRISRTQTASATVDAGIDEAGAPLFRSFVMQCGTPKYIGSNGVTATDAQNIFGSGSNNNNDAFTPTLASQFINGTNEGGVPGFDAKTWVSFFDTTTWIGAVRNTADNWYAGWTCNMSYLTFGTGNSGACTSLPVT